MNSFTERHKPTGTITNQPGKLDMDLPHASTYVCDRPQCRSRATRWVAGATNMPAVYVPFGARKGGPSLPR